LTIDTNNNPSDGYVVSVDTNGVLNAPNNKIGYTFVASTASSTNVTSLTLSNLNIKADDVCRLYVHVSNLSGSDSGVRMYLNGDETATNYWAKGIYSYGNSCCTAEIMNEPRIGAAFNGCSMLVVVELYPSLSIDSVYRWHSQAELDPTESSSTGSIRIYSGRSATGKTLPISTIKIALSNNGSFKGRVRLFCNKSGE
jgi:hypothetical protein